MTGVSSFYTRTWFQHNLYGQVQQMNAKYCHSQGSSLQDLANACLVGPLADNFVS